MSVKLTLGGGKKKKKLPEKKSVPSVFGGDEDVDDGKKDEGPMDWRRQAHTYKRKRVDEEQLQKAKEQDPSFAEYDEVYDSMVCSRTKRRKREGKGCLESESWAGGRGGKKEKAKKNILTNTLF